MAGISVSAFNNILLEFLSDLAETFPEHASISEGRDLLRGSCNIDEHNRVPLNTFMDLFESHSDEIMGRDSALFAKCKIPFIEDADFNLGAIWSDLDQTSKDAIWNYLHQLLLLGNTIRTVSPDMLAAIEGVAQSCIDKVNSGEMSAADAQNPLAIMTAISGNEALMQTLFKKD